MLEFRKRMHKVVARTLLALVLLQVSIDNAEAATKCHKCTGINCQRTTYAATEDCADALDSCVSVFQGSTVLAQGCLGQLAVELRNKCEMPSAEETDEAEMMDADGSMPAVNRNCHQCSEDLCNNVSAEGFDCIQCDSNADDKCASDTENLQPERCSISKAMNTYCYAKIEGNRATRGCATDLTLQIECSRNSGCSLCSPSDIVGCNRGPKVATDESSSSGSSSGGGTEAGTGNDGSSSGGSDSGSSSGSSGSGSDSGAGSGTGDGGSSSGVGGSGSDSGAVPGTGNDGSSSGGSDSGSSSGGSDSGSESGAGSGSDTGDGGSNSDGSSGTGDSGSSSGSSSGGTGSDTDGGDSSSGSGSSSSDNSSSNNGSVAETSSKLLLTMILMILPYFI